MHSLGRRKSGIIVPTESTRNELAQQAYFRMLEDTMDQSGLLKKEDSRYFIDKDWFAGLMGVVIMVNSVEIGVQTDSNNPDSLGFLVLDNIFTTLYLGELVCRLYLLRWNYFKSAFNMFDMALVLIAVADTWIVSSSGLKSLTVLRILRMMRLARLLRLLRFFKELWQIVSLMGTTMKTLGWVSILLFGFLWICSIFINLVLGDSKSWIFVKRSIAGPFEYFDVQEYFGKTWRSFFTLFQISTLDKWSSSIVRPVGRVYPYLLIFFICFLLLSVLGLLNVMTAIICRDAIISARTNKEQARIKLSQERKKELIKLKETMRSIDFDKNGFIERREVVVAFARKDIAKKFISLGVKIEDALALHELCDRDEKGVVSTDELINAIVKMKGETRNQDVIKLIVQLQGLSVKVSSADEKIDDIITRVLAIKRKFTEAIFQEIDQRLEASILPPLHSESAKIKQKSEISKDERNKTVYQPPFSLPCALDLNEIEEMEIRQNKTEKDTNKEILDRQTHSRMASEKLLSNLPTMKW